VEDFERQARWHEQSEGGGSGHVEDFGLEGGKVMTEQGL
jgi:hypothetical protein